MHTLRALTHFWLIPVAAFGLGCSSMRGPSSSRATAAEDSKIRTIASIGDRPISSTTGTPTSSAVANLDTSDSRLDDRSAVSGHVVDDRGEPVSNARIRVADGGLSGGKVVQAKSDRAGGFTLHGLRAGSNYTLIAEYEGQDGLVEGRSEVKSPQSGVEIAVQSEEAPVDRRRASRAPASRKVSERQPIADPDQDQDRPLKLNREDMPSSSDVEDLDDLAGKTSMNDSGSKAIAVSSWRRSVAKEASEDSVASSAKSDHSTRRVSTKPLSETEPGDQPEPTATSRPRIELPPAEEDEGENPLPPAIHPSGKRGRGSADDPDREQPPSSRRDNQTKLNSPGPAPGALVLAKDTSSAHVNQPQPLIDPFGETPALKPAQSGVTFGDLSETWKAGGTQSESTKTVSNAPRAREKSAKSGTVTRREALPKLGSIKAGIEAVRYDSKNRRLENFRLPDLDGKPVTLRDLDNDLILLDFWGTWCRPCLNSVPHLVDLQKRLGSKGLTIVGIACEEGPASVSAAHVAEVAEQLGINYTVLLSSKDEPSPLLEALHIQAFPTMVVIDRQGRVVWREQGATDVTLARLDRVVESPSRTAAAATDRVRR